jgi:predicted adenylyl cyclase CyaB
MATRSTSESSTTDSGEKLLAELKARCADLAPVRAILERRAQHETTTRQTDTYFHAPRGRLKLREVDGRPAQLIFYERPDVADVKTSQVSLAIVPHPGDLRRLLETMLGVRVVVAKLREIWRLEGVQVHLDTVDGLGAFVELEEVVASAAALPAGQAHVRRLMAELGIAPDALAARSYSDLVEAARTR